MHLPIVLQVANSLLVASKGSHDMAVTALTSSTQFLLTHDVPRSLRDMSLDILSHAVMLGDKVGNFILQMYVILIHVMN